ncbi:hypothetical protein [Stenotrophomonas sp. NPDC077659]|uniref:hypothetical protein n=1 Tax=Stenotrophomonas sp. NPDC077659 TaxID=3390694 RepID=UPI003D081B0A
MEHRLEALELRQAAYERELKERDERIADLESRLQEARASAALSAATSPAPLAPASAHGGQNQDAVESHSGRRLSEEKAVEVAQSANETFGIYTPGSGFKVARTTWGELNISAYSYLRYLNQSGLDRTYVDHFGNVREMDRRNDVQMNKILLYNHGWFLDPRFRYTFFLWGAEPALGTTSSILVAGNLAYVFNDKFTLAGGVLALPSTRSLDGQFPLWQRVDARMVADEFMRGSYTQGFSASGTLAPGLKYKTAIGNNLSSFGVSASRLDNKMDTWSLALSWMPTTGEFGPLANFGDFEQHEKLATLFSGRFTSSTEDRESQPGLDTPENTQVRLSSGVTVFTPNALGLGSTVERVDYRMAALSAGLKYQGFYLEAEVYRRWLDGFRVTGAPLAYTRVVDDAAQIQGSMMVVPKRLQVYANASKVFGEFGDPWDAGVGLNWWPYGKRGFRLNGDLMYVKRSPIGSPFHPFSVGATGWTFNANAEIAF